MLGIVKAIMMVKHGVVLPTAGFEKMNPKIKGQEKMKVVQGPTPWPKDELRRALVTNFGRCCMEVQGGLSWFEAGD